MMLRKLALIGFIGLAGCSLEIPDFRGGGTVAPPPVAAPAPITLPQSAKERFIATTAANGCTLNSTNSALILEQATLSRADLARIMTELKAEGRGQIAADGTSFQLMTSGCI
jgi:hypothetical protein